MGGEENSCASPYLADEPGAGVEVDGVAVSLHHVVPPRLWVIDCGHLLFRDPEKLSDRI